jgi:flagellar biosynthesis/type III secretory pathway protein FliH
MSAVLTIPPPADDFKGRYRGIESALDAARAEGKDAGFDTGFKEGYQQGRTKLGDELSEAYAKHYGGLINQQSTALQNANHLYGGLRKVAAISLTANAIFALLFVIKLLFFPH